MSEHALGEAIVDESGGRSVLCACGLKLAGPTLADLMPLMSEHALDLDALSDEAVLRVYYTDAKGELTSKLVRRSALRAFKSVLALQGQRYEYAWLANESGAVSSSTVVAVAWVGLVLLSDVGARHGGWLRFGIIALSATIALVVVLWLSSHSERRRGRTDEYERWRQRPFRGG